MVDAAPSRTDPVGETALRRELDGLRQRWPGPGDVAPRDQPRMRSVFGSCRYARRELHLAAWHVEHGEWADVLDTLRHEAAHALAGPKAGHRHPWRTSAHRLGA